MGLFNIFKRKNDIEIQVQPGIIYAPIAGNYISLESVPDETFASGVLGQGCGIEPEEGKVYAPVNGKITMTADTKHAVGLIGMDGTEYLIHVGIDTVRLNGKYFELKVHADESVTAGQLLLEFDMEGIKGAGYTMTSAFVMLNYADYPDFSIHTGRKYMAGEAAGRTNL